MDYNGIELTKFHDYYVVCNRGDYFKLNLREGRIIENLKNDYQKTDILELENISEKEYSLIINELVKYGVIGERKKVHNNILFYKLPLLSIDNFMEKCNNIFLSNKIVNIMVINLLNLLIISGLILVFMNSKNIFKLDSVKLPVIQYIYVYIIFILIICIHEFAHGLICKHFGGKVGKVGIIFILFNPAFYCDISGVRMFRNKKHQILSSFAGLYVNAIAMAIFSILYFCYP
ncbi:MAG TPA: hypothetical protein VN258_07730 [Mobilitalea sp.]|nr:hypothetical protein [Mobilitalea sp.]